MRTSDCGALGFAPPGSWALFGLGSILLLGSPPLGSFLHLAVAFTSSKAGQNKSGEFILFGKQGIQSKMFDSRYPLKSSKACRNKPAVHSLVSGVCNARGHSKHAGHSEQAGCSEQVGQSKQAGHSTLSKQGP